MELPLHPAPVMTNAAMTPRLPTLLARTLVLLLTGPLALTACQSGGDASGEDASNAPPVVEVVMADYAYRNIPDSISAGWTTFRVNNEGQEIHHLEFERLPEGITPQDHREVMSVSRELAQKMWAGEIDRAEALKRRPSWVDSVEGAGGLGHLAPGRTASITTRLEPGTYSVHCYINTAEGRRHFLLGMEHVLTVTPDSTGAVPPEADLSVRLFEYEIHSEGTVRAGEQTIAVHFEDRQQLMEPPYQGLQLARLPDEVSADRVAAWLNVDQAPAPTDFLGGAIAMEAGKTVYLTVNVSPGRYAWVSDASEEKGMMETFAVE